MEHWMGFNSGNGKYSPSKPTVPLLPQILKAALQLVPKSMLGQSLLKDWCICRSWTWSAAHWYFDMITYLNSLQSRWKLGMFSKIKSCTHAHIKALKMCLMQPVAHKKEELLIGQLIARSYGKNKFLKLSWSWEVYVAPIEKKSKTSSGIKDLSSILTFNQEGAAAVAGSYPASFEWGQR